MEDSRIDEAATLARAGKMNEADIITQAILKENPTNGPAWVIAAGLTLDYDERITYLNKAITSAEMVSTRQNRAAAKNARKLLAKLNS